MIEIIKTFLEFIVCILIILGNCFGVLWLMEHHPRIFIILVILFFAGLLTIYWYEDNQLK